MNSDHGGLLKARAESFARHLQTRLKSLSDSESGTWSEVTDSEVYYDIDSSLASPQEEAPEPIFVAVQNRDSLPLQRTDSEASTYFDAEESLDDQAPLAKIILKKTPLSIINLKTEIPPTITNGQTSFFDDKTSFGFSGSLPQPFEKEVTLLNGHQECLQDLQSESAFETSSLRVELEIFEKETEKNCDSIRSVLEKNNNDGKEFEEASQYKLNLGNSCDVTSVECDTGQFSEEIIIEIKPSDSLSCVFCDIEQIKSSLSNGETEYTALPANINCVDTKSYHKTNGELVLGENVPNEDYCVKDLNTSSEEYKSIEKPKDDCQINKTEITVNKDLEVPDVEKSCISDFSDNEENIPLTELLQELRLEMKNETDKHHQILESKSSEISKVQKECPNIEIRESSPVAEEKQKKHEEEEFDIETRRKYFRRSSSLKSGKTPPGTPGCKKIVRFADVLGLDLADVKTFLDEVPTVPMSAFQDLQGIDVVESPEQEANPVSKFTIVVPQIERILVPLFQQPCIQPNFLDRVRHYNVCLENAIVSDMSLFAVTGVVRVKNIDFHKSVYIRYTINNWHSFSDLQATYVTNSYDGFSDKFTFALYAHTLNTGQKLEFAVRFNAGGAQYWDSNGGLNYTFVCNSFELTRTFTTSSVSLPLNCEETASFY